MDTHELLTRGVEDVVPRELAEARLKTGKPLRIYFGIDPTSNQLHIGHCIPLRKLQAFSDAGHEAILLIGSFTAMIGDPSGRDSQRIPLTEKQINENFKTYKKQASKILDFKKIKIVYNHKWLGKLNFKDVLGLAGHITVQQMLQREMFKRRIAAEQDISTQEFLYPLMQGYDSVALDVDAEIGGSDQLFNMLAGRTLLKAYKNKEKFVLTTPLLEGLDGRKMSKSYGNTVNITDEPTDMFGKIMSLTDNLIIKYFLLCTDLPIKEIDEIDKAMKSGGNPRDAKIRLAYEIVKMYHSAHAAAQAQDEFARVFAGGGLPDSMPEFKITGSHNILDLLLACKLAPSRSEARRLVEQGGVRVDEKKVSGISEIVHVKKGMILKVGKRGFAKII